MKAVLAVLLVSLFTAGPALAQRTIKAPDIKPAETAPSDVYHEKDWFGYYDDRLAALEEPSLWELSKNPNNEAIRFFYVPDEGHAIIIRVDIPKNGPAILTEKRSSGKDGDSWGRVIGTLSRELSPEELEDLKFRFDYMKYWYVERDDPENRQSRPGPLWLYEAIEGGKYHAVERTNPAPSLTRNLGLLLLGFIELDESDVAWPKRPTMD